MRVCDLVQVGMFGILALLTGCATQPVVTTVRVPVPIACQEEMPERPAMPTEAFTSRPTLDQFAKAALAEIERRQGFEGKLVAALEACRAPIK